MVLGYRVKLSSSAEKTLHKLDQQTAKRIIASIEQLSNDPYNHPQTKKMKGQGDHIYRLRVGNYRVIYEVIDDQLVVFIVRIGPRGDIYK